MDTKTLEVFKLDNDNYPVWSKRIFAVSLGPHGGAMGSFNGM